MTAIVQGIPSAATFGIPGISLGPPPFDRQEVEGHISLLHDLAAGQNGILILAAIEEGSRPQIQRFRIGDVDGMTNTIMGFDGVPGRNLYSPWCIMRGDLEPNKKGCESDVVSIIAAVGDLDNDKYRLGELPINAPYIVESSEGNFQPVFPLTRPLAVKEAKPVLTALSDFIGGDTGTKDASHVWRIPGTLNWPNKSKLARGRSPIPQSVKVKKHFDGRFIAPQELLALAPPKPNGHDKEPPKFFNSRSDDVRLSDALRFISAEDYDTWIKVGMACHGIGARRIWDDWSASSEKFDPASQDYKWKSFHTEHNGNAVTIASIFQMARDKGWRPEPLETADMREDRREEQKSPRIINPTFWIPRDPTKIPRRQCLYGKHYYRKYVSTTVAPGGRGKTSLVLVENIAMATGLPLLGVPVPKRSRVWYWNGEDPQEEIDRRVTAVCLYFGIDQGELAEWLCTDNGRDTPICIADQNGGKIIFSPDTEALTKALINNAIDVLTLDPFIKTHGVSENDNGAIDRIARQFAAIANEANSSIELPCHVRKASSSGAIRGAPAPLLMPPGQIAFSMP